MKDDGSLIKEGDLLVNTKLGATLQIIADEPWSYYNGSLAQDIVDDIAERGNPVIYILTVINYDISTLRFP